MTDIEQQIALHLPAARRGDRKAFSALVAATQTTVTTLALAVVRDVQLSEDIAQEAYFRVWQRLRHLESNSSFLPWLRQITRNLARDHLRRRLIRPLDLGPGPNVELDVDLAGPGHASSEERALLDERDRIIAAALESLPTDSREVLALFYREGESSRQVARLLGLSDATVRKRLQRARNALRQQVEKQLGPALLASAPGVAFSVGVGAMLTAASPPAAAGIALGAGAKGAGAVGLAAVPGLAGGIAGVVLGLRGSIRSSVDPLELEGLLRIRRLGILTVVLAAIGFTASTFLPGWLAPTTVFALFLAALGWQNMVMLPRVLAGRHARERQVDPDAARKQLRARRLSWLGLALGALLGGGGLIAGLLLTGRIVWGG